MVGTLIGPLARGATWLFGNVRSSYSIPSPNDEKASVGLVTLGSTAQINPVITDGRLHITIDVEITAVVVETALFVTRAVERSLPTFERLFEEAIGQEIKNTIDKLRHELGADIFGVADKIYRKSPQTWKAIEPVWDEVYASSDVTVNVEVMLVGEGFAR